MYPFTGVRVSCLFLLRTVFSFTSEPFVALLLLPLRSVAALAPQLERSAVYPGAGGRMANSWDEAAVRELSRLPTVDRAFALGSVLAVEMKAAKRGCARARVLQSSLRGTRSHMKRETGQERERERQREPRAERLSRKFGMFWLYGPSFVFHHGWRWQREHPSIPCRFSLPRPQCTHPPRAPGRLPLETISLFRYDSHGAVEVVQRLHDSGVYARVLGNVAYVMVSPTTPAEACGELMATVTSVVRGLGEESARGGKSSRADAVAYSI